MTLDHTPGPKGNIVVGARYQTDAHCWYYFIAANSLAKLGALKVAREEQNEMRTLNGYLRT